MYFFVFKYFHNVDVPINTTIIESTKPFRSGKWFAVSKQLLSDLLLVYIPSNVLTYYINKLVLVKKPITKKTLKFWIPRWNERKHLK